MTLAQSVELVCNVSVTYATVGGNGQLEFAPFPEDFVVASEVEYDAGALGPWYSMSEGIINVVRPGSVTEDVIVPVLGVTVNISTTGVETVEGSEIVTDVVQWASGIIVMVVLGGLISISFLLCGCVFCSCRVCCKKCGGDLKQKESEYTNCLTMTFTVILVLFTCGLIVGVVFAFLTNQQVYDVITEAEETVNASLMDIEGFVNDGLVKVDTILCTFNTTVDLGIGAAEGLITTLDGLIETISNDVNVVINSAVNVSNGIDQSLNTLEDVNGTVTSIQSNITDLNEMFNAIANSVDELVDNCTMTLLLPPPQCSTVDGDVFRNAVLTNFTDVPNIDSAIANVQDVLSGENLTALAEQGKEFFETFTTNITDSVQTSIDDIVSSVDEIRDNVTSIRSTVVEFTTEVDGSDGVIQQAQNTSDAFFDLVRQVDVARYAVGVVICSLAAIVVVVVFLGVVCGILGFRTDRAPYERTSLSNCGAYSLLCSVVLAVFFGSFLMILSALVFFTGSISYKFCEDLAGPDYVLFTETIDNPEVVGGEYILSSLVYGDGSIPLTVSGILNNCSENATVYVALQLENIIDLDQLTNVTEQFPDLASELANLTANQNISTEDFISDDVRQRLQNFTDSGIAEINITQYREQIDTGIVNNTLLEEQLMALQNLSATFSAIGRGDLANQTMDIIMQIEAINDSVIAIEAQVDVLQVAVDQLNLDSNELTVTVERLLNQTEDLVTQINDVYIGNLTDLVLDVYGEVVDYVEDFVNFVIASIENEVGNCYPLFAIYTGFYNTICESAINSLNGFWLALGWCAIFFIPVSISAIITSQYYRRMKYDDIAIPYDDSFPLKTY